MPNPPVPPVPAAITKIRPRVSLSTPDNLSNQSQATTSPNPITSSTSSTGASQRAKSPHPWMTIVHPGPWTKLPPAPSPLTPPGSSSLPAKRKGWFKPRVTPPNPFAEADEDANSKAGQKAFKKPANQTKPSEPTSQSRNDSRDTANAASVSDANSEVSPFDQSAPSETPPCEDPSPPSAQTDVSAASSPGLGESSPGEPPAAAGIPEGLGNTPKLAKLAGLAGGLGVPDMAPTSMELSNVPGLGSLTGDGPLNGIVEGANPLGSMEAGAIGDVAGGLGIPMGLAGLDSELGVPDMAPTSMDLSNIPGLGSLTGDGPLSGRAEGANPLGSLNLHGAGAVGGVVDIAGGLGVPDLMEMGSLGGLASSVTPPDLASFGGPGSLADIGSGLGVPGVPDVGECPAMGDLMESACPGASAAAPGLPSIPKSFSVPIISSALKKGQKTPSQSEASFSRRAQAPGYGLPPVKRMVQTDACVPTDDLQGELGDVNKRLEELELCNVQLENNPRDCENRKEEEAMLVDVIQEKHLLVRRDTEITHLTKQNTLEERQADLEYKLRCLLIKPESEWSAEDRAQEQKMLEELLTVVEQRNQIVCSLEEERQREEEEDCLLEAMQEKEFQKKGLKEWKKSKRNFKPMKVFRMLSSTPAQESKFKKN